MFFYFSERYSCNTSANKVFPIPHGTLIKILCTGQISSFPQSLNAFCPSKLLLTTLTNASKKSCLFFVKC